MLLSRPDLFLRTCIRRLGCRFGAEYAYPSGELRQRMSERMADDRQREFEEFIKAAGKEEIKVLLKQTIDQESLSKLNQLIDKAYDEAT